MPFEQKTKDLQKMCLIEEGRRWCLVRSKNFAFWILGEKIRVEQFLLKKKKSLLTLSWN